MKINNFAIIIGAMKCGTTSLYKYLIEHPQIAACRKKEPSFFSKNFNFSRGAEYYQNLWNYNPNIHKIALEATPGYTRFTKRSNLNAAEKIAEFQIATNSNFKFIYIMRNPIKAIESQYTAGKCGQWSKSGLYDDTSKLISRDKQVNIDIVDTVRYNMQIEEYYKRFPLESILLLQFEELKNNPSIVLKKICQFLEIDAVYKFQTINQIHNSHTKKTKVFLPGYSLIRSTRIVDRLIDSIPDEVREEKIGKFRKLFTGKTDVEYVKLTEEEQNYVLRELQDDLIALNLKHGVDLSLWELKI